MNGHRLHVRAFARILPPLVVWASACAPNSAFATAAEDSERARLAHERTAIEARFAAQRQECAPRFVVTACVNAAKSERRHALDAVRKQQIALDEVRRRERSAARRSELATQAAEAARLERERAGRAARTASAPAPTPARDEVLKSKEPRRGDRSTAARTQRRVGAAEARSASAGGEAARQPREERSRATFDARQRQAAEHREDVLGKTIKRMQQRSPAAPLPLPAASSSR